MRDLAILVDLNPAESRIGKRSLDSRLGRPLFFLEYIFCQMIVTMMKVRGVNCSISSLCRNDFCEKWLRLKH